MAPRSELLLRRVGGLALTILGAAILVWPISHTIWAARTYSVGVGPKVLYDLAYTASLGLMVSLVGLYFLTKRAKKAPEDHDKR